MSRSSLPCPSPFVIAAVLWLLTRVIGGILLIASVCYFVLYVAEPERIPNSSNPDFADGLGGGALLAMLIIGGVGLDFYCSLPLLLGLPAAVRRAQRLPAGHGRGRRFAVAVAVRQVLPSLVGVGWMVAVYSGESLMSFILTSGLCMVALYLVAALFVAALLYRSWLAHCRGAEQVA